MYTGSVSKFEVSYHMKNLGRERAKSCFIESQQMVKFGSKLRESSSLLLGVVPSYIPDLPSFFLRVKRNSFSKLKRIINDWQP